MHRGFRHMGFGHMGPGYVEIWTLILFFLIVIGIIIYFSNKNKKSDQVSNQNTALDILDQRYAKGEIDTLEYREKKKELKEE